MSSSQQWIDRADKVIMKTYGRYPIVPVRGQGCELWDADGKRYLDFLAGVAVNNLGHCHPEVVHAVKQQVDKYMHLMVYGEFIQRPQVRLAEMLARHLPNGLDSTYFVNSGSEAIEGAMKLAKRVTGRPEIVAFRNAYHGSTHGALSILGNEGLKNAFRPLLPGIRFLEFNSIDDLDKISRETACVVVETIQAEAGIIPADNDFMQALRQRCSDTGALLVIDDIQMGFGRTGVLFSFEHYGIVPDILTLAKAMGGGMPIGAFISSAALMQTLSIDPELGHITTFGGHPVSAAAALAGFEILVSGDLVPSATRKGQLFHSRLVAHRAVSEIRYKGLMMAVELHSGELASRLVSRFLEKGLVADRFLFNQYSFRIAPPLIITDEEVHMICDIILKCLDSLD